MELIKLRYFYVVAKHQHVTKAAEEIHIAQPALTKAIKQLEEELETPLFYKKGRNIFLTEYGKYLQNKLDGIFAGLDGIQNELKAMKGERSRTVKLNVLAASTAVTSAVVAYKKKDPDVVFQLIQNEAETDCDVSVSINNADFAADKLPVGTGNVLAVLGRFNGSWQLTIRSAADCYGFDGEAPGEGGDQPGEGGDQPGEGGDQPGTEDPNAPT